MTPAPAGALAPFRHDLFRRVWVASTASNIGGMVQTVGAAWLMLSLTHSETMVALVQASVALPVVLLSLVAGAVADNVDRRRVLLAAQLFMLVVAALLALLAWRGLVTPWLLLSLTFLIGCGSAFNAPAWQAAVGDMVPRDELAGAVALNSMGFNVARSVGPALGGAVVAAVGAAAAFAINALSYVGLVAVLARWRPAPASDPLPRESLGAAIRSGLRYVAMSPAILTVFARSVAFGIGASAVIALMPLVASRRLAGGPLTYGLLLGAFGVGAVAGVMSATWLRTRLSTEGVVRAGSLGFALAAVGTGASTMLPATLAALVLGGAAWVLTLSTFNVAVQLSTSRWVVARALSLYQMSAFGGLAGGSAIWGAVSGAHGLGVALYVAALVLVVCAAIGLRWPVVQVEARNLDPLRRWDAPATAVPVDARTGPVVVTVEYRIREEDLAEFLATMAERRRIRRRDGARDWALLRDVAEPAVWIERYSVPTWLDYIRHNNRITHDDASGPQRLRALHQGPGEPRVRRMIERPTRLVPDPQQRELHEPMTDPHRTA